jgi:general secretion pathway protein E
VALCDELLYAAMVREASDIHIDPGESSVLVRFRVDGVLEPYRQLPTPALIGVISRFKVLGGMDIAEKRSPQDGRFTHRLGPTSQKVDIRVATLPTKHGERMTLRLLALQTESLTIERLGMSPRDLVHFERAITKPHGMILLTGPTGSGKTTTLYAALRKLIKQRNGNIVTIEDPIEYDIPGVAQVEVDSADKISFDRALRSVLRHDPDIVMIGEIRDRETAGVAIKAALTGHLVFSTLHTNSAASVVTRLHDMGMERYLVAATLRLAVAQRLVRRLCRRCRKPRPLSEAEAVALACPEAAGRTVYDPGGCLYCANRGYVGRMAIFELLPSDEDLSREIAQGCEEVQILQRMREQGVSTLIEDAAEKVFAGETTVRDVLATITVW